MPLTTPPDLPLLPAAAFVSADPLEPLPPFPPRRDVDVDPPPHTGSLGASHASAAGVPHTGSLGASHVGAGGFQSSMDVSVCLVLIFHSGALQV